MLQLVVRIYRSSDCFARFSFDGRGLIPAEQSARSWNVGLRWSTRKIQTVKPNMESRSTICLNSWQSGIKEVGNFLDGVELTEEILQDGNAKRCKCGLRLEESILSHHRDPQTCASVTSFEAKKMGSYSLTLSFTSPPRTYSLPPPHVFQCNYWFSANCHHARCTWQLILGFHEWFYRQLKWYSLLFSVDDIRTVKKWLVNGLSIIKSHAADYVQGLYLPEKRRWNFQFWYLEKSNGLEWRGQ